MELEDKCYMCGTVNNLTVHHIMNGPFRKKSEEYGGLVRLCFKCHRKVHDTPLLERQLKARFQREFEEKYSHDLWMKTFRKDYLWNFGKK